MASALFCGGIFCPAFTLNLQSYEQLAGRFQHLQISQAVVQGMFSYWRELYEAQSLEERFTQKWNMSSFTRPHVAPNANDFIFFCGTQKEDFWREFSLKELSNSKNGCRSSSDANGRFVTTFSNFPMVPATFKDAVFLWLLKHTYVFTVYIGLIYYVEYIHTLIDIYLTCI